MTRTSKRNLLKKLLVSRGHLLLPLMAAVIVIIAHGKLLTGALVVSGDNLHHLLNEHLVARAAAAADNVLGPLAVEYGSPVLRFYQSLFYLAAAGTHLSTGLNLQLIHNLLITLCFSLSPFCYYYFLRKLGLRRWASSLGSMATILSIAGFGNSFEAYHGCGIATQTMGAFFFPLFMGTFIGLLRGENRITTTALLFALAFLSHAIMAVYAVFGGALYFLVSTVSIRTNVKRLALFAVLGSALVSFWVFPFISHTEQFRSVPDSVARGTAKRWWFAGLSDSEMVKAFASGKLLDDPRTPHPEQTDPLDKKIDRINIAKTWWTRPPAVTLLTILGAAVALFGFRRPSHRFLLVGLAFSLILLTGPDDTPWLRHLPFMKHIQTFRTTYLLEFFAFGLVGLALAAVGRLFFSAILGSRGPKKATLATIFATGVVAALSFYIFQVSALANTLVRSTNTDYLNSMLGSVDTVPAQGYPFTGSSRIRSGAPENWWAIHGWKVNATHWGGVVGTSALQLTIELNRHPKNTDLDALAGRRYLLGDSKTLPKRKDLLDDDGFPAFHRMARGESRSGRSNAGHILLDTQRESLLRPLVGEPLPVICNDAQWMWITRTWTSKFATELWRENTPLPLKMSGRDLLDHGIPTSAGTILFLNEEISPDQLAVLRDFADRGGNIISPLDIDDLKVTKPKKKKPLWQTVRKAMPKRRPRFKSRLTHTDEMDPGLELVEIVRHDDPLHSNQRFTFDVEAMEETVAFLPTYPVPGWRVLIDDEEVPSYRAGPDLLAFLLPGGVHRVTARWEMPPLDRLFMLLSIWTFIGILSLHAARILTPLAAKEIARLKGRANP